MKFQGKIGILAGVSLNLQFRMIFYDNIVFHLSKPPLIFFNIV